MNVALSHLSLLSMSFAPKITTPKTFGVSSAGGGIYLISGSRAASIINRMGYLLLGCGPGPRRPLAFTASF